MVVFCTSYLVWFDVFSELFLLSTVLKENSNNIMQTESMHLYIPPSCRRSLHRKKYFIEPFQIFTRHKKRLHLKTTVKKQDNYRYFEHWAPFLPPHRSRPFQWDLQNANRNRKGIVVFRSVLALLLIRRTERKDYNQPTLP